MKSIILTFLVLLVPVLATQAAADKDVLTQMLEQINKQPKVYAESEYEVVTVSPDMMKSVIQMLESGADLPFANTPERKEMLLKMLANVNGLRILNVPSGAADKYGKLMTKMLANNKARYKEVQSNQLKQIGAAMWVRQSNNKVVEILLINKTDAAMQVINFTGQFSNEFISMLKQM